MKIAVVADTHSRKIPPQLLEELSAVDCIVHAGDFCSLKDLEIFKRIKKEFKAVYGNMDEPEVKQSLPEQLIFNIEGIGVGVYHGAGPAQQVLESVESKFKNEKVDVIIFGHSHQPFNQMRKNVLFFNPGSPNDTIFAPYLSYGIIEIKNGKVLGKIIKLKGKNG